MLRNADQLRFDVSLTIESGHHDRNAGESRHRLRLTNCGIGALGKAKFRLALGGTIRSSVSSSPSISVVIPTYQRPELLRRCLEGLRAQDLHPDCYEVVVVDDGSGPATAEVLQAFGEDWHSLTWVSLVANRGPAAARNKGIELASGDWLLFMDDDIVAPSSLVRTHIEYHANDDQLVGILGRVQWHPDLTVTRFMRWLDTVDLQFAYESDLVEGRIDRAHRYFYTCNLSLSRDLICQSGGFNEAFPYPALEDTEMAIRLCRMGFQLDYRPAAVAWNSRPITLKDFCHRMTLVGESSVILRALDNDSETDSDPLPTTESRWRRISRQLLKGVACVAPVGPIPELYYQSEIWQSQIAGIRKGYARVATWDQSSSAPSI